MKRKGLTKEGKERKGEKGREEKVRAARLEMEGKGKV